MYRIVEVSKEGRHVVENDETGERYRATPDAEWLGALTTWRKELDLLKARLEPIWQRAQRRRTFLLNRIARRAGYRTIVPCPMPWGHGMFNECRKLARKSKSPVSARRTGLSGGNRQDEVQSGTKHGVVK